MSDPQASGAAAESCTQQQPLQDLYYRNTAEMEAILEPLQDFSELAALITLPPANIFAPEPPQLGQIFDSAFALPCLQSCSRQDLFEKIKQWALAGLRDELTSIRHTSPPPEELSHDVRMITASQCRGVLANALLGNVRDFGGVKQTGGGLGFNKMIGESGVGLQKLAVPTCCRPVCVSPADVGVCRQCWCTLISVRGWRGPQTMIGIVPTVVLRLLSGDTGCGGSVVEFQHIRVPATAALEQQLANNTGRRARACCFDNTLRMGG